MFYDRREDITTFLRVHSIPGVMDFFDYSPAATGMTYRNSFNPDGVTIDGVPDTPAAGVSTWEQLRGSPGGLSIVHSLAADTPLTVGSYYLDDSSPGGGSETQCTGDNAAYGSSGLRVTSTIPNTDPRNGTAAHVTDTRHLFFGSPSISSHAAETKANQIAAPLQVQVRRR